MILVWLAAGLNDETTYAGPGLCSTVCSRAAVQFGPDRFIRLLRDLCWM